MKKIIPLIFSVLYMLNSNAQAVGGWGNCEFATVATMNAFDPSTNAYDCKKVFVQATDEHYHWDGTQWVLDTDTENIYNADGTLITNRTMTMDGNNLTFDGTGSGNVVIKSNGHIGIRVPDPQANLHVGGDARIRLQQAASGGNVEARYDLNAGGDGKFYLENKNNATVPFAINKLDNVGIGTTTPNARLDVEGGTVRFSDYGAGANSGTITQLLGVEADGDVIEIDASNAAGTGAMDNIYTTDGIVQANRTVDLDGKNLTFAGTNDVFIESTGQVGIGTTSPAEELHVVGDSKISKHLYVGANASAGSNTVMRVREHFSLDANTYQIYSAPIITGAITGDRHSNGAYFDLTNNKTESGSNDSDASGGFFRVRNSGTATYRSQYGLRAYGENRSTAASGLGNLYGAYLSAIHRSASGTVANTYGTYSQSRGSTGASTGIITNGYGIRSDVYSYNTNITNAHGIYANVGTNNSYSGDITTANGVYGRVYVDSDDGGDITTGRGGYFQTSKRAGANLMTTAYGLQIDANSGVTTYGIRIDADDAAVTTNYGLHIDSYNATTNNYGIFGERGDWVLDQDGDGVSGGTGSGGDLILGEGQDLELYHDGANSNIINNTGDLIITDAGTDDVIISTNGGNTGIGTTSPDAKLDVEGGTVRFSDYGAGTNSGTETYILGVEADGDVVEIDPSTLGSSDNIYTADGTLGANRTVDLDGKTLTFDGVGTGDVIIQADGDVGIGTVAPAEKLEVAGTVKIKNNLYTQGGKHIVSTPWHSFVNPPAGEYLVLSTPIVHNEGNMFRLDIELYDYSGGEKAGTIVCTGYAYGAGSLLNVDCHTIGIKLPIYLTKEVRADQGGQEVIVAYIGNLSNDFYFPQATVRYSGWQAKDPVDFKWSTQSAPVPAGNYNNSYIEDHSGDSYFNAGDVGIGTTSPDAKLDVENGTVRFSDYGAGTNGGTSTRVLGVDVDGDVIEMNTAKSSRIFYPPAMAIVADVVGTSFTLDLHQEYVDLFSSPMVSSAGAPTSIPTYLETELYYQITDFDTDVFENVSISASGIMTYDVKAAASDNCSFMNVVFVVKD